MNERPDPERTRPLSGHAVFTVRPTEEARGLLRALRAWGADVVNLPVLRLQAEPVSALSALQIGLHASDRWLFSSPAAVRHIRRVDLDLHGALFSADGWLAQAARSGQVFAPGPGTAQALARLGIQGTRIPDTRFDSEGLLALPELAPPLSGRLYLLGAPGGRGLLAPALTARGLQVENVWVYRREAVALSSRRIAALSAASRPFLLLSSQAALQALVDCLPSGDLRSLQSRAWLVVASARLRDRARALGFHRVQVAISARPAALVAATVELIEVDSGSMQP